MIEDNSKIDKIIKQISRFISTKTLFTVLFLIVVIILSIISKNIYTQQTELYKDKIYSQINNNIIEKYNTVIDEKINNTLIIASTLSKISIVKTALEENNPDLLDMDMLLDEMRTNSKYSDIEVEIIDNKGISFKRSWTNFTGDDLVKNDQKMAYLLKYPSVVFDVESSKFGMMISSKIPIYKKAKFLGFFVVNIHFNSVVDEIKKYGFDSVVLLNKIDSQKVVQEISYSKMFLNECYIANSNANRYLVRVIKSAGLELFCGHWEKEYMINTSSEHLVSKYIIKDKQNMEKGVIFIFKSLDTIDYKDLNMIQDVHIVATIFILLFLMFFVNYLYTIVRLKELSIENEELIVINEDLKMKTDEMDFNDKKLDNLFNMQPNLMIMHNGKEVTKGNKRFMGFFNRFGTFEGFKKKHKCVSELFEKYEAPNYIWEQYIEGEFWVDYILDNPRRLYKTVMSVVNRQGVEEAHHFIIKLNEMDYAKHVTERIIIIALVDMTQDLVNYKTLDESKKDLKSLKDKLEVKEEMGNSDISTDIQEQISQTLSFVTFRKSVENSIKKVELSDMKSNEMVKIDGIFKFSNIESQWTFIISLDMLSLILNTMLKVNNTKFEKIEVKDLKDSGIELTNAIALSLCERLNKRNYYGLDDARYTQSKVELVTKKEIKELDNLYEVYNRLDGLKIKLYISFDNDIVPFISSIVNPQTESTKAVETKKQKLKKDVELYKNYDTDYLIVNGYKDTFADMLKLKVKPFKLIEERLDSLKDKKHIQFSNIFKIDKDESEWTLLFNAQTLSILTNIMNNDKSSMIVDIIDKEFVTLAKIVMERFKNTIELKTDKKVELISEADGIVDSVLFDYSSKLYSISYDIDSQPIKLFILKTGV